MRDQALRPSVMGRTGAEMTPASGGGTAAAVQAVSGDMLTAIQPAVFRMQGEGHFAYLSSTLFLINYSSATFFL